MDPLLVLFIVIAIALVLGPILLARVVNPWNVQVGGGTLVLTAAMILLVLGIAIDGDVLVPILLVFTGAANVASGLLQRKKLRGATPDPLTL